jgi:ATP-dependent helicase/nuclease subunit B
MSTASPSRSRASRAGAGAAFDDLLGGDRSQSGLMVQLGDYPEVFQTAFADRMVRRPEAANAHCTSMASSKRG